MKKHILERIDAEGGWIPFALFMDLALHAPGLGYYAAGSHKFGRDGDFVTAPEITPYFGRTLARQVAQVLEHSGREVLELGAGSGALAADIVRELERIGQLPTRYCFLEPSAELADRQRKRIERICAGLPTTFEWLSSLPTSFSGAVIANEVLDALPAHLLAWRGEHVFERGVCVLEGNFAWEDRLAPDSLRMLANELDVVAPYVSEVCPAAAGMITEVGKSIDRGAVLVLDYGYPRRQYYHPERSGGTLMCHYRHYSHDNPLVLTGLQDITAHVDFTAVAQAAVDAGLDVAGFTDQARFLVNSGITELLAQTDPDDVQTYLPQVAAVQKLLSPVAMGDLFKVMALTRGIEVPLLGFVDGDRLATL